MEIKTRFNVGDKVYNLTGVLFHRIEPKHKIGYEELKITGIEIYINALNKIEIKYRYDSFIVDSSCDAWIEERNLFATKEEAQKECERRNGK